MGAKKVSVTVRVRKGVEQRSRCGHSFGKEPQTVEVTSEELERIKDDPRLNIVTDKLKPEAKQEAPEAKADKLKPEAKQEAPEAKADKLKPEAKQEAPEAKADKPKQKK